MFQFLQPIQTEFPSINNIRMVLDDRQHQTPSMFTAPDDIIAPATKDSMIKSITYSCFDRLTILKRSSKYNQLSPYSHHVVIKLLLNSHQALYCILSSNKMIKFQMQMQLFQSVQRNLKTA